MEQKHPDLVAAERLEELAKQLRAKAAKPAEKVDFSIAYKAKKAKVDKFAEAMRIASRVKWEQALEQNGWKLTYSNRKANEYAYTKGGKKLTVVKDEYVVTAGGELLQPASDVKYITDYLNRK